MSHDHDHGDGRGHSHGPGAYRSADRRLLAIAAALTSGFMVAEVVGGLITGSLALLADAAHMLSDSFSLVLALVAVWLAARPTSAKRTFGFKRAEILAALLNGLTLVGISIWIFYEAAQRFRDPPEVLGTGMLVVAVIGLLVNFAAAGVLARSQGDSLNVAAAFRHVVADILGSIGVIVAAVVILLTGWDAIDPLISVLIGVLIAGSAWTILRDSVDILLESAPREIDTEEIGRAMASVDGVVEVHDLHVWTITSGFPTLTAHVQVSPQADCHERRRALERLLHDRFEIDHTTLQVDHASELLTIDPGEVSA